MQMEARRRPGARAQPGATERADALGLLLHSVSKGWRAELDRRLRPLGLTRAQWQALFALSRAGGTLVQRERSEWLEIGAPATVALVDRMERDGLVARTMVPGDRRRNAIVLTARARRLVASIQAIARELRFDVTSGLTHDEIDTLVALLGKVRERIEGLRP
ncbi:MAG TPA: MarR family transcriptional regulator [Casimicrobiaceae bacterium]|nr:MarR family transcriptional regulator [Casimicrobiaceae bacterium]